MVFNFYLLIILGGGSEEFLELLFGLSYYNSSFPTGQTTSVRVLPTAKFFQSNYTAWKYYQAVRQSLNSSALAAARLAYNTS